MSEAPAESDYAALSARYQGVIDAAVDGIVIIDESGTIETFNAAAERIFGYRAQEVLGRNVGVLMPERDAAEHDGYIRRYLDGAPAKIIGIGREVVGRRKNGELFPMDLAVGEVKGQTPRRFVGMVRDISERRAVEQALAGREQELRLIFDSAPIGIFTAAPDGRFTAVNPALCKLLGHPGAALLGMTCEQLTVAADRARLERAYAPMVRGEQDHCHCELRWRARDGTVRSVLLHAVMVRREGREDTVIGQVVDHSDRVRSELESREAGERLAQVGRVTTLGEMASAIAHEINQPLTAISAYAQACRRMLDSATLDADTISETLDAIAAQALRAGDVVKRIRSFVSHRESGRSSSDINAIIDSVLALAEVDARLNEVEIVTDYGDGLPPVLVDTVQIQQVCLNLIRNAIDAMGDLPAAERWVRIVTRSTGQGIVARFEDNGPGVGGAFRAKLFQPFQTTKKDGMGMGLSISKSIINAHGGELALLDDTSRGAVFALTLPEAGS